MRITWMVPVAIVLMTSPTLEQDVHTLALMHWPAKGETIAASGHLVIDSSFAVGLENNADARLRKAVALFLNDLRRHTGMLALDFNVTAPEKAQLGIHTNRAGGNVPELGEDESYTLEVTP